MRYFGGEKKNGDPAGTLAKRMPWWSGGDASSIAENIRTVLQSGSSGRQRAMLRDIAKNAPQFGKTPDEVARRLRAAYNIPSQSKPAATAPAAPKPQMLPPQMQTSIPLRPPSARQPTARQPAARPQRRTAGRTAERTKYGFPKDETDQFNSQMREAQERAEKLRLRGSPALEAGRGQAPNLGRTGTGQAATAEELLREDYERRLTEAQQKLEETARSPYDAQTTQPTSRMPYAGAGIPDAQPRTQPTEEMEAPFGPGHTRQVREQTSELQKLALASLTDVPYTEYESMPAEQRQQALQSVAEQRLETIRRMLDELPPAKVIPMGPAGAEVPDENTQIRNLLGQAQIRWSEIRDYPEAVDWSEVATNPAKFFQSLGENLLKGGFHAVADPGKQIPFMGSVVQASENLALQQLAEKVQAGTATPEEQEAFAAYQYSQDWQGQRGSNTAYTGAQVAAQIPKYAAEFAALRKVPGVGGEAVESAALTRMGMPQAAAAVRSGGFVPQTVSQFLRNSLAQLGSGAVMGAENLPMVAQNMTERMIDDYETAISPAGEVVIGNLDEEGKGVLDAAARGLASSMVEMGTETFGEVMVGARGIPVGKKNIGELADALKLSLIGKWLRKRGIDPTDTKTALKALRRVQKQSGFGGIFTETVEEEVGEPLQAIIDEREYQDPITTEEGRQRLATEVFGIALFGLPAQVGTIAGSGAQAREERQAEETRQAAERRMALEGQRMRGSMIDAGIDPRTFTPLIDPRVQAQRPERAEGVSVAPEASEKLSEQRKAPMFGGPLTKAPETDAEWAELRRRATVLGIPEKMLPQFSPSALVNIVNSGEVPRGVTDRIQKKQMTPPRAYREKQEIAGQARRPREDIGDGSEIEIGSYKIRQLSPDKFSIRDDEGEIVAVDNLERARGLAEEFVADDIQEPQPQAQTEPTAEDLARGLVQGTRVGKVDLEGARPAFDEAENPEEAGETIEPKIRETVPKGAVPKAAGKERMSVPVGEISTDVKRFQGREEEYSEESVQKLARDYENGDFRWEKFDDLQLWRDPKDGKLYVLAGHSRLEFLRRMAPTNPEFREAPVRVIEGIPEKEAIKIAKQSNVLSSKETELDRAKYFRGLREEGKTKKDITEEARLYDGRSAPLILALSHLSETGKAIQDLRKIRNSSELENINALRKMAQWIGRAREAYPELSDTHENELYDFLRTGSGQRIRTQGEFLSRVADVAEPLIEAGELAPGKRMNIENRAVRSAARTAYDEQLSEAKRAVDQAKRALEAKRRELIRKGASAEDIARVLRPLDDEVTLAQQEYIKLRQDEGSVQEADRAQGGLFDMAASRSRRPQIDIFGNLIDPDTGEIIERAEDVDVDDEYIGELGFEPDEEERRRQLNFQYEQAVRRRELDRREAAMARRENAQAKLAEARTRLRQYQREYDAAPENMKAAVQQRIDETEREIQRIQRRLGDRATGDMFTEETADMFDEPARLMAGKQSQTADSRQLWEANRRLDAGEDADVVRQETGWYKGADGKWRYEINDRLATLTDRVKPVDEGVGKFYAASHLGTVLNHPALFAAYPQLAGLPVIINIDPSFPKKSLGGSYNPGTPATEQYFGREPEINITARNKAQALTFLLHEIQHGIQTEEGFARGGNYRAIAQDARAAIQDYEAEIDDLNTQMSALADNEENYRSTKAGRLFKPEIQKQYRQLMNRRARLAMLVRDLEGQNGFPPGYETYIRQAGEVESRNVEARQEMSGEERRMIPPEETEDISRENIIVMFNGRQADNAPPPANARRGGAMERGVRGKSQGKGRSVLDMADEGTPRERRARQFIRDAIEVIARDSQQATEEVAANYADDMEYADAMGFIQDVPNIRYLSDEAREEIDRLYDAYEQEAAGLPFDDAAYSRRDTQTLDMFEQPQRTVRFEAGKKLTLEERREVLSSMGDSYKELGAPKVYKGLSRNGEEIYGYVYNPDYMFTSDITGRKIRYHVTLPDGRRAHPSELYPNVTQSHIDKYILEEEAQERGRENRKAELVARAERANSLGEANLLASQAGHKFEDVAAAPVLYGPDGGIVRAVLSGDAELLKEAGFTEKAAGAASASQGAQEATAQPEDTGAVLNSEGNPVHPTKEGQRAFKAWFGDSKVVDGQGRPLVVYHGTREDFTTFDRQDTAYGYFFTPDKEAADFYGGGDGSMAVYLKAGNILRLDEIVENGYGVPEELNDWIEEEFDGDLEAFISWLGSGEMYGTTGDIQDSLMEEAEGLGYDGVVFYDARGGGGVALSYVVFEPSQIKSATGNRGTFDLADADITHSRRQLDLFGGQELTPEEQQEDIQIRAEAEELPTRAMVERHLEGARRELQSLERDNEFVLRHRPSNKDEREIAAQITRNLRAVRNDIAQYERALEEGRYREAHLARSPVARTRTQGAEEGLRTVEKEENPATPPSEELTRARSEMAERVMEEEVSQQATEMRENVLSTPPSRMQFREELNFPPYGWRPVGAARDMWFLDEKNYGVAPHWASEQAARKWARKTHKRLVREAIDRGENLPDGALVDYPDLRKRAFKAWFGDSKVVDENGKPRVVYNGVAKDPGNIYKPHFNVRSEGGTLGFFFTPSRTVASYYASDLGVIKDVYLSIKKPLELPKTEYTINGLNDALKKAGVDYTVEGPEMWEYAKDQPLSIWVMLTNEHFETDVMALKRAMTDAGYDGMRINDDSAVDDRAWSLEHKERMKEPWIGETWVAFYPNQIKSATGNRGTYSLTDDDITRSAAERDMVAVHGIKLKELRLSLEEGAFPAPSLAILPKRFAGDLQYGPAILVARAENVLPENDYRNAVYDADVYSPRYPEIERDAKRREVNKFADKVEAATREAGFTPWYPHDSFYRSAAAGEKEMYSEQPRYYYLTRVKGEKVDVPEREVPWQREYVSKRKPLVDWGKKHPDGQVEYGSAAHKELTDAFKKAQNDYWLEVEKATAEGRTDKEVRVDAKTMADTTIERFVDEEGLLYYAEMNAIASEARRAASEEATGPTMEPDTWTLRDNVTERTNNDEYDAWVESVMDQLYGPKYVRMKGRKSDPTPENIVTTMLAQGVRAREQGMANIYGIGQARAAATRKFKSSAQIKADKGRIATRKEVDAAREKVSDAFFGLVDRFDYEYPDQWDKLNSFSKSVGQYLKRARTKKNAIAALRKNGFSVDETSPWIDDYMELAEQVFNAPVPYFEAKPAKVMGPSDFAGIALPENVAELAPAILGLIEDAGIPVQFYKKGEQQAAVDRIIEGAPDAAFSRTPSGKTSKQLRAEEMAIVKEAVKGAPKEFTERVYEVHNMMEDGAYHAIEDVIRMSAQAMRSPSDVALHELGHRFFVRYAPESLHESVLNSVAIMDKLLGPKSAEFVKKNYRKEDWGHEMEAELFRRIAQRKIKAKAAAKSLADRMLKFAPENFRNWTADKLGSMFYGAYKMAENTLAAFGSVRSKYNSAVLRFIDGDVAWSRHDPDRVPWLRRLPGHVRKQMFDLGVKIFQDRGWNINGYHTLKEFSDAFKSAIAKVDPGQVDAYAPHISSIYDSVVRAMVPATPGISYPVNVAWALDEETQIQAFNRKITDEFSRVKEAEEAIEQAGGEITEAEDPYLEKRLSKSLTRYDLDRADEKFYEPLKKALAMARKRGVSYETINLYLIAKHAPRRNRIIAERREFAEEWMDGGSGMTNDEAQAILDDAKARGIAGELENVARRVYAILKEERRIRGKDLEGPEAVQAWEDIFGPYYVPLRTSEDGGAALAPVTRGFWVKGKQKSAAGRTTLSDNPIEWSILQLNKAIIDSHRNDVAVSLFNLARKFPNPDLWEVDKSPTVETYAPSGKVRRIPDPSYYNAMNVVEARVGGEIHRIEIKDDTFAKQFAQIHQSGSEDAANAMVRLMGKGTRIFTMLTTAYNPPFMARNFLRDVGFGGAQVQARHGAVAMKKYARYARQAIPGILRVNFAALEQRAQKKGKGQNEWKPWLEEFKRNGGPMGWYVNRSLDDIEKDIFRSVEKINKTSNGMKALAERARLAIDVVEKSNEAVELASRLAYYRLLIEDYGYSPRKAALAARELTVDFDQKGEWGKTINSIWAFSNAGIQGTRVFLKFLASPRGRRVAYGLALASFANAMLQRMIGGDDDNGVPYYEKESTWNREANVVFMLPGTSGSKIQIPLPYGLSFFWAMGQIAADFTVDVARGGESEAYVEGMGPSHIGYLQRLVEAGMSSFNPLGGGPIEQMVTPTVFEPAMQSLTNKNWNGSPIRPEGPPFKEVPDVTLAFKSVNPLAKYTAEGLSKVSGGEDYGKPGAIDVSPETIELWADFVFGGLGKTINQTLALPVSAGRLAAGDKEALETRNVPVVRYFYGSQDPAYTAQRKYREIARTAERVKGYLKNMTPEEREAYMKANPGLVEFSRGLNTYQVGRRLSAFRNRMERAASEGDYEKRDEYEQKMIQYLDTILSRYGRMVESRQNKEAP